MLLDTEPNTVVAMKYIWVKERVQSVRHVVA